jgi:hypothetical protein
LSSWLLLPGVAVEMHLSGKTFAELIQEGARPELGSCLLLH